MNDKLAQYKYEITLRKRNLDTKRQVQAAENAKEQEMLMLIETMLEKLLERLEAE